jgi:hypothetical protein
LEEEELGAVEWGRARKMGSFISGGRSVERMGWYMSSGMDFERRRRRKAFLCFGLCVFLFMTAV